MEYIPAIVQAVAGEGRTVYAYYSDGTVRKVEVGPLIQKGGVFARLADDEFFAERLTVINDAVAWDVTGDRDESRCIDLDPWTMYETAPVVADPLEVAF